jgi:Glycosyl transferase family 11
MRFYELRLFSFDNLFKKNSINFFLQLMVFLFSTTLQGNEEQLEEQKPFVTCLLQGQLANQMNQIATTLAYAWDYDVVPIFHELNKTDHNIAYNREHFFFRLNASFLPRPVAHTYYEFEYKGWWTYAPIPYRPDQYLYGSFFCWKNFHHHRQKLVELFAPSEKIEKKLNDKYSYLLNLPCTVSVHIRTYNQEHHEGYFPFVGLDYYEKALEIFPSDATFIVFSDRINWCKHHFAQFNKNFIFIEENDHIEDFFLMSKMNHHIVGNSCFSWWASYLNEQPDKIVVAPHYWYRIPPYMAYYPQNESDYLIFPEWITIKSNLEAPYPSDMKNYDEISKSLDTQ